MAVPKKRTSKTRKNLRKANWKAKASIEAKKALSTAKLVLNSLSKEMTELDSTSE
jgi:large subunit ribosomal protein L32